MDSKPNIHILGHAQHSLINAMLKARDNYLWEKPARFGVKRFVRNNDLKIIIRVNEKTFTTLLDRKVLIKFKEGESYKVYRLNNRLMKVSSFAVKK